MLVAIWTLNWSYLCTFLIYFLDCGSEGNKTRRKYPLKVGVLWKHLHPFFPLSPSHFLAGLTNKTIPGEKASPVLTASLKKHICSFTSPAFSGPYTQPPCLYELWQRKGEWGGKWSGERGWDCAYELVWLYPAFLLLSCHSLLWSLFLLLWGDQEHRDLLLEQMWE